MRWIWRNVNTLSSKSYVCSYCSNPLASEKGYVANLDSNSGVLWYVYICHSCDKPTFFDHLNNQYPGAPFGGSVQHIPTKEVSDLYNEARNCMKVDAYTAAVLCCRKLLMNIAVSHGANEGLNFAEYVDYLGSKGFVPPKGESWIDHIRKKGNDATHQVKIMTESDAKALITFIEMLLKFIYEFPGAIEANETKSAK